MNKKTKLLLIIIIIIFLVLFIYSFINIVIWKKDSNKTYKEIEDIQKRVKVVEVDDTESMEIVNQEDVSKNNPYWGYIKMNMLDVDFSELSKINSNVKGWIQVNGTNVNYPFVQANDNKYYLTHSFDKSWNSAGWLFLDYRNNYTNNKNTIIYAHGRSDKTMFGSLKNVLSNEWLSNSNNYIVKISTERENSLWQIFSVYRIPTTSDYLQTNFSSDKEYLEFLNMLLNRSSYNFNTFVNSNDNILTLSTCYNNSDKMVVHAKLIKRSVK